MSRLALMLPAFLATAVAICPLSAQIVAPRDYGPVGRDSLFLPDSRLPGPSVADEVDHIRGRIDRLRKSGAISRREARRLDREARRIGVRAQFYSRDGLSRTEREELRSRAAVLNDAVSRPR